MWPAPFDGTVRPSAKEAEMLTERALPRRSAIQLFYDAWKSWRERSAGLAESTISIRAKYNI